ncbi:hypothetical protein Tco_0755310 [Tanacetum coccineum]
MAKITVLVKNLLIPLAIKSRDDAFAFEIALKKETFEVLEYVQSLEKELDELQLDKNEFSNEYDLLLQDCVSKDVMCSILHSLDNIDEQTELQFMYLDKSRNVNVLRMSFPNELKLLWSRRGTGKREQWIRVLAGKMVIQHQAVGHWGGEKSRPSALAINHSNSNDLARKMYRRLSCITNSGAGRQQGTPCTGRSVAATNESDLPYDYRGQGLSIVQSQSSRPSNWHHHSLPPIPHSPNTTKGACGFLKPPRPTGAFGSVFNAYRGVWFAV